MGHDRHMYHVQVLFQEESAVQRFIFSHPVVSNYSICAEAKSSDEDDFSRECSEDRHVTADKDANSKSDRQEKCEKEIDDHSQDQRHAALDDLRLIGPVQTDEYQTEDQADHREQQMGQ